MNWGWGGLGGVVLTTVVTTLVVEYLVKPRLEARKERILQVFKVRAEFLERVVTMSLAAEAILLEPPPDSRQDLRNALQAQRDRQYGRLQDMTQELVDNAGRYGAAFGWPIMNETLFPYIFCMHGVMLSSRARSVKATVVRAFGKPIVNALEKPPWWRILRPVFATRQVKVLIARAEDPQQPDPGMESCNLPAP